MDGFSNAELMQQRQLLAALETQERAKQEMLRKRLLTYASQVREYEDPQAQEKARSIIPIDELRKQARESTSPAPGGVREEEFLQLLHWFKREFFSWVNTPPCPRCDGANGKPSNVKPVGTVPPNAEESRFRASRTEEYICQTCGSEIRFPRYNCASKLLDTRRGRCGEWAQAFTLCCRAMGYEARFVVDWTDHVWTEIYSEFKQQWTHCDPCEDIYDRPYTYEVGWGKKLSYVVAFSAEECVDVTRRYTRQWEEVKKRRTEVSEESFARIIREIDQQIFSTLPPARQALITARKLAEMQSLLSRNATTISPEEMRGRISGAKEWREARGELGMCSTGEPAADFSEADRAVVGELASLKPIFSVSDFHECAERIRLVGSAAIDNATGRLYLTPAVADRRGAAWHNDLINLSVNFEIYFRFQISRPSGSGADGFAYVFQCDDAGTNAIGGGGCDLGYGGLRRSLAVEFDTYRGIDTCADPDDNHISVHTRGEAPNSPNHDYSLGCTVGLGVRLADGRPHDVRIVYVAPNAATDLSTRSTGRLYVFVTDGRTGEQTDTPVLSVNVDIAEKVGHKLAIHGFTAATGGLAETHEILTWQLRTAETTTDANAASAVAMPTTKPLVHIPVKTFMVIDTFSADGVLKKALEFNSQITSSATPHSAMTESEVEKFRVLVDILKQPSLYHIRDISDETIALIQSKLVVAWPAAQLFPVLDVLRMLLVHPGAARRVAIERLLSPVLAAGTGKSATAANRIMSLRVVANALATPVLRDRIMVRGANTISPLVASLVIAMRDSAACDQKAVAVALSVALQNFVVALVGSEPLRAVGEKIGAVAAEVVVAGLKTATSLGDTETIVRNLAVLGTLLVTYPGTVTAAVKPTVDPLCRSLLGRKGDVKLTAVAEEVLQVLVKQ